jgi:hypothetical protein
MKQQQFLNKRYFSNNNFFFAIFSLSLAVFMGCEGDSEPVPAYLTINDFVVKATDPSVHGTIDAKITHANVVLINNNTLDRAHSIGIVELPVTVPVLVNGDYEVNIDPVIKANGNSFSLDVYPFYNRYVTNVSFSPNMDLEITPETAYSSDAKFWLIEDFETAGHLFSTDRDGNDNTALVTSTEDVFEGNSSGMVKLDTANSVFVTANGAPYEIIFPDAARVFMEVNYKTEIPLEFGVILVDQGNSETPVFDFVVLPQDDWNKIYFDMTTVLSSAPNSRYVFIVRGGIPFRDGQHTMDEATVFLDNIKVVSF